MSSTKYERVPHSDSDIDLDDVHGDDNTNNSNDNDNNNTFLTNLLKLTAHRRIIQQLTNNQNADNSDDDNNNTSSRTPIISINDDKLQIEGSGINNNDDIKHDKNDNNSSSTDSDDNDDDITFDDHIFLLFLDGTKKRIGIQLNWKIYEMKQKYFLNEIKNNKNIRLIYRGQMLLNNKYINDYNIPSNGFIHVSISNNIGQQSMETMYNNLINNNNNSKDINDDTINYNNFDDGMDDEAFARMLQRQELQNRNREMGIGDDLMINMNDNDDNNNINNGNNNNNNIRNNRADQRDFACGLLLGLMIGIWVFIFLLFIQRQYSRRFRLGVLLGVFINIIFQISTTQQQLTGDVDDGNTNQSVDETPSD